MDISDRNFTFGDAAMDEHTIKDMVNRLDELTPKLIFEFGSGTSTLFLANWAQENGARVISLDHLKQYADKTRNLCAGLKVEVQHAPLRNGMYNFKIPNNIDFALIDGPPAYSPQGRVHVFPALWPHLSSNFEVWLDDANRKHEQKCLQQWSNKFPISFEIDSTGKGLAIIRPK